MTKNDVVAFSAAERLARLAGVERISPDAVKELSNILEDFAKDVAIRSVKYAKHAKRNTIKREDIELAASE